MQGMQGDYYTTAAYNQVPQYGYTQQQHTTAFQFQQYPVVGATIPTIPINRNVDMIKKTSKYRYADGRRNDESTNSTDESIHLVRSRKGSGAVNKSGSETPKKRSQSGNSIGKSPATSESHHETQRNRSKSVERQDSKSPGSRSENNNNKSRSASKNRQSSEHVKGSKNKKKKDRKKNGGIWHFSDIDSSQYVDDGQVEHIYLQNNNNSNIIQTQLGGCPPQGQQMSSYPDYNGYVQQNGVSQQYGNQPYYQDYGAQYQQQPQQDQYYGQQYGQQQQSYGQQQFYGAPGGPVDYGQQYPIDYTQSQGGTCYDGGFGGDGYGPGVKIGPLQDVGPIDPYAQQQHTVASQSYGGNQSSDYMMQGMPGLPPGAKIVAEYFLGYLDDQNLQQSHQVADRESSKDDVVIEVWEKSKHDKKSPDIFNDHDSGHYNEHEPRIESPYIRKESPYRHESRADESRVERRTRTETPRGQNNGNLCDPDVLKKLKDDIINSIQKELGNLKLNPGSNKDAIQPIFLMPKQSAAEQPKPIYIPRNIYVPVIRPVFVPRERIIVRPQIIHVARPVLVDRPVPIQQRPIVIERDRPVPVRVETVERNDSGSSGGGGGERNIHSGQEVTYHEFTQSYPNAVNEQHQQQQYGGGYQSSNYESTGDYDTERRKQEVIDILDQAERRKQNLESRSNEDLYNQNDQNTSKNFDSLLGNSQGYTLEVLDQRVSEKFVKTDPETIKARYGVESFQYLPTASDAGINNQSSASARAASSLSSQNDYYNNAANASTLSGAGQHIGVTTTTSSRQGDNVYANSSNYHGGSDSHSQTPYGTITNVAQIPSPGSRQTLNPNQPVVIQNVQKMIQNFSGYPGDQNAASSLIIEN